MKRRFDYNYYFNSDDYRICFEYGITKADIERTIRVYINANNICKEDSYLIDFNDNIEVDFSIVDITECEYTIEVDNLYLID